MSIINLLKSQSKTVLAAVAITAATVGFAGGMSVAKSVGNATSQSQATLAQNQDHSILGNQTPPAPNGRLRGMPPGKNGAMRGVPSDHNANTNRMSPNQATIPPDVTSGSSQSNTSSDEVNALKEKNKEIKAQISGSSVTSNQ
ncbi:hypothetical protein NOL38_03640 [Streptococcus suis]|uniref:hypothetical protein n=1 Tax=Streptococcus suis TaxID=1307 RepID=UPI000CF3C4A1|nr:hypothetical protein [Streptococcus suis]MDG4505360.1 hypothetical protein [Streptococcus suis]